MRINCKVFSWDKKNREVISDLSFELTSKTPYSSVKDDTEKSTVFLGGHPYTTNIPYTELKELFKQRKELKGVMNDERNYPGV